jgi:hypothetical protein
MSRLIQGRLGYPLPSHSDQKKEQDPHVEAALSKYEERKIRLKMILRMKILWTREDGIGSLHYPMQKNSC